MNPSPVRTVCARDCYDSCGLIATPSTKGRMQITGDPAHPVNKGGICGKCAIAYNGSYQNDALRLTTPLRRTGKKGAGQFTPISWDEALGEISDRLHHILDNHGPAPILNAHYTGTRGILARDFPMRFFNAIGATEVTPDTICNIAGQHAARYLYGNGLRGFDPREIADAQCVVVWGCNPSVTGPHTHRHWLKSAQAPLVVVDPIKTDTALKADLHLQLQPGSDSVLAFAILKLLKQTRKLAGSFIDEHVLGWNEVEKHIDELSLERAELLTGVSQAQMAEFADLYAAGPALLWVGMGMTRQRWGGNAVRSILLLPAATANVGRAGSGFAFINGAAMHGVDLADVMGSHLRARPMPEVSHMDLVERLKDASSSKALFCWNINISATGPRQAALRDVLAREDLFTIVADLYMTDTADQADLVLPAANFLEHDDVVYSYFHMTLSAQVAVRASPGVALPNQEIFRRLARRMGMKQPELAEPDAEILDRVVGKAQPGMNFQALKQNGTVMVAERVTHQFQNHQFPTESGKIEVASAKAQLAGLPLAPMPIHAGALLPGQLRLLTPAGEWMSNSAFGNDPKIRRRFQENQLLLNPKDAAATEVDDGSEAIVSSSEGSLQVRVVLSDDVLRGVAVMPKNGWAKLARGGATPSQLMTGQGSDMGNGSAVQSLLVTVRSLPDDRRPSGRRETSHDRHE